MPSDVQSTYSNQYNTSLINEKLLASSELMNLGNLDLELSVDTLEETISMTTLMQSDISLLNINTANSLLNIGTYTNDLNKGHILDSVVSSQIDSNSLLVESHGNEISDTIDKFVQHEMQIDATFDDPCCNDFIGINSQSLTSSSVVENELIDIIDLSPEMSTTSGGNKIILIGSWNAKNARYYCRFGTDIVDAELIQNGVLRCYSPST